MISVSWIGANLIVGGSMTTGQLTSMFSYIMMMLMSLMMLSGTDYYDHHARASQSGSQRS